VKHNPAFLKLVEQAKQRITECCVEEVQSSLDRGEQFHFLDIREDHEFFVDHARGACHRGKGILERDIETVVPDKEAVIVLYCGGGFRSALAGDALQQIGYQRVRPMKGGIRAWREAGYPLE